MIPFASERDFQAAVVALARSMDWLVFHVIDSRKSTGVGFPDLVLVHRRTGRTLFWELKTDKGKLRPEQQDWLDALGHRHEAAVIRPAAWESGLIQETLTQPREAFAPLRRGGRA